ncbi:hypothetical protein AWM75_02360 [Aerococcus urinaehominis]|uniref:Pseudouridine synthase n=1 Tax=Aerococcus urinaehominis TaxID=128944 RepID=A0A109RGC1_9LACT|nr:pseudouridine synthase [Aerococcus urinaehominis]AMB98905.1 hypothetical protein AWM75_02360 [Aerococcus urinaehominis]SDM61068.1 16S rRNA pseudouridine516 synthase [Aerococcus urinaehominis]
MRLDKLISQQTIYSRKEVKKLIRAGRITVNGQLAQGPNQHVDEVLDTVSLDDEFIQYEPYIYYLLNKPAGYISSTKPGLYPTVISLLEEEIEAIYQPFPVGRLDVDTEGLLLITNDGDLAHQVTSPRHEVEKEYYAEVLGLVTEADQKAFKQGLDIGEDQKTKPSQLFIDGLDQDRQISYVRVILTEGKFHQVKRMFEAVGKEVSYLKRIRMGQCLLPDNLEIGEYLPLFREEAYQLFLDQA